MCYNLSENEFIPKRYTLKELQFYVHQMILGAIAGLSLFLYGMQLMGDGLQKSCR